MVTYKKVNMKKWITLFCGLAIFFTACNKQDIEAKSANDQTQLRAKTADENSFYASDWESVSTWKYRDSARYRVFYAIRETPSLTTDVINNGLVVTYSKVISTNPDYIMFSKPIMLPFIFLPPGERPMANTYYWFDTNTAGTITTSYSVMNNKEDNPEVGGGVMLPDFQFRYFVISPAYLASKGVDANTVKYHYTYQQLINFLGLKG
jgi:hypothetical protein